MTLSPTPAVPGFLPCPAHRESGARFSCPACKESFRLTIRTARIADAADRVRSAVPDRAWSASIPSAPFSEALDELVALALSWPGRSASPAAAILGFGKCGACGVEWFQEDLYGRDRLCVPCLHKASGEEIQPSPQGDGIDPAARGAGWRLLWTLGLAALLAAILWAALSLWPALRGS